MEETNEYHKLKLRPLVNLNESGHNTRTSVLSTKSSKTRDIIYKFNQQRNKSRTRGSLFSLKSKRQKRLTGITAADSIKQFGYETNPSILKDTIEPGKNKKLFDAFQPDSTNNKFFKRLGFEKGISFEKKLFKRNLKERSSVNNFKRPKRNFQSVCETGEQRNSTLTLFNSVMCKAKTKENPIFGFYKLTQSEESIDVTDNNSGSHIDKSRTLQSAFKESKPIDQGSVSRMLKNGAKRKISRAEMKSKFIDIIRTKKLEMYQQRDEEKRKEKTNKDRLKKIKEYGSKVRKGMQRKKAKQT